MSTKEYHVTSCDASFIMGQALLMTLLNSVTDATLTTGSLDGYDHQRLAQLLCDVMATCSHESVVGSLYQVYIILTFPVL